MINEDLIRRGDAIREIERFIGYLDEDMITRISIALKRIPTVKQPRKGKWVKATLIPEFVTCSYCKEHAIEGARAFRPDYTDMMNFCMICGADMRKERK